jgi:hypothetical protein
MIGDEEGLPDVIRCVQQNSSTMSSPPNIMVVIPFVARESEHLYRMIRSWDNASTSPCDPALVSQRARSTLIFYVPRHFHVDHEYLNIMKTLEELVVSLMSIKECFSSVQYIGGRLTSSQDTYGVYNYISSSFDGPNIMFYNMMLGEDGKEVIPSSLNGTHVLYVETDASFVKNHWLDAAYSLADANVWQVGSPGWFVRRLGLRDWLHSAMSLEQKPFYGPAYGNPSCSTGAMNGNALYRHGDRCFNLLLSRAKVAAYMKPYDLNLWLYFCHPKHVELTKIVKDKFRSSNFMVDVQHREWIRRDIVQSHSDVYIITQGNKEVLVP